MSVYVCECVLLLIICKNFRMFLTVYSDSNFTYIETGLFSIWFDMR